MVSPGLKDKGGSCSITASNLFHFLLQAFQTTIPGSNSLQCSIQDETSSNFSNMRNIDEFRDTQHSASKYHTVHSNDRQQRVPVKQEHRAHNSYHGNKSPTIEDLDRLQFQDESSSSSSDPL